jgi:predicted outer membrane protein
MAKPEPGTVIDPNAQPYDHSYDFILSASDQPPPSPKNRSKLLGKPVIRVLAGVGLIVIIGVVVSVFMRSGESATQDLVKLMANQLEIARVSDTALKNAQDPNTKALAATTKNTLISEQKQLNDYLTGRKVKIPNSKAISPPNKITDQRLTIALQNNNFDNEYVSYLKTALSAYQTMLSDVYPKVSKGAQSFIKADINSVKVILSAPQIVALDKNN